MVGPSSGSIAGKLCYTIIHTCLEPLLKCQCCFEFHFVVICTLCKQSRDDHESKGQYTGKDPSIPTSFSITVTASLRAESALIHAVIYPVHKYLSFFSLYMPLV